MAKRALNRLMWWTLLLAIAGYSVWSVGFLWFLIVGALSFLMILVIVHTELPPAPSSEEFENGGVRVRPRLDTGKYRVAGRAHEIGRPLLDIVVEHIGNTRLNPKQRELALCIARMSKLRYQVALRSYSNDDVNTVLMRGIVFSDGGYLVPASEEMADAIEAAFGPSRLTMHSADGVAFRDPGESSGRPGSDPA
jgi:hypothetical protein